MVVPMNDSISWDAFYEKYPGGCKSPYTWSLHNKILKMIPDDCQSILDAGCGSGKLMALLAQEGRYSIEGVDQSFEGVRFAVEKMQMKAQVGNITNLHLFKDNSFDMVICSEVLEHLRVELITMAIKEFSRISKRYLILTNPFREKLYYHHMSCAHCFTVYHPAGHIHSVDESFILPLVTPWAKSIHFFYSGQREYSSSLYAGFLRANGFSLLNLETCCPVCGAKYRFKKWSIPVRISGYMYRFVQMMAQRLGIYSPANIITFVELK